MEHSMQKFGLNEADLTIDDQDIKTKGKESVSVGGWAFRIIVAILCLGAIGGVVFYALQGNTKPGGGKPEVPIAREDPSVIKD